MKESIFEYQSYKQYLNDLIRARPGRGRGMKAAMAEAAHCQSTYVSQVLHGSRHFSLEQTELINLFLGHSEDEARYFISLVSWHRAGNPALRARLRSELNAQIERQKNLKDRLKAKNEVLDSAIQNQYYQAWFVTAVHICLTVSRFRTKESIAKALGLPLSQVTEVLHFLVSSGLAEKKDGEFRTTQKVVFVGRDSPLLTHHHVNWRHQAIRSIELGLKDDLHYSSVVSLPAKEVARIHSLLLKAIAEARDIWKNSADEEELHSICVDFFKVNRD